MRKKPFIIQRGEKHQFRNKTDEPLEFLGRYSPPKDILLSEDEKNWVEADEKLWFRVCLEE